MTLHRVTVAAFTALLLISGIGTLMARQGPPSLVPPVELSDDASETPPAVGGEVEEVAAPDLTDARATAPDAEPTEVLVTTEMVVEEAPPADATSDVGAPDAVDDHASDDDGEGDADDDD